MSSVLIADSFLDALAGLAPADTARGMSFVTDLRRDRPTPGASLERCTRAKSDGVWSGRLSQDMRVILYKDGPQWVVLYVDHHDEAYRWAEHRTIERHPKTGVLQVVETVESIREIEKIVTRPVYADPPLFEKHASDYLLSLGVPEAWLPTIREIRDEEQLLRLVERLPKDVGERLLDLADGQLVTPPTPIAPEQPAAASPDAGRHFYLAEDDAELAAVLEAPLEKWLAFLHPSQRSLAMATFNGPVLVTGSAGTGKTVVAIHRARHLARHGRKVLLTSFQTTLCGNLERSLGVLCSDEELRQIHVSTVHKVALRLVRKVESTAQIVKPDEVHRMLDYLAEKEAAGFDPGFVRAEWASVIEKQGIESWEEYRDARRSGRGRPLGRNDREVLWKIFDQVRTSLQRRRLYGWQGICRRATAVVEAEPTLVRYDAVVVDEVQDLSVPELRLLKALAAANPAELMLVGDAGQRIFAGGFSLRALGIEVRGRSRILRINYRTTDQIRRAADRLLASDVEDLDQAMPGRTGARSLLRGPDPVLRAYPSWPEELAGVIGQVRAWIGKGLPGKSIGVFARHNARAEQVQRALAEASLPACLLTDAEHGVADKVQCGTMHRAKGLEFRAVLVADCASGVVPSAKQLAEAEDDADRDALAVLERRLLYVAMTRAREQLVVSWSGLPSPFLASLRPEAAGDADR